MESGGSSKRKSRSARKATKSGSNNGRADGRTTRSNPQETPNKRDSSHHMPIANVTRTMQRVLPPDSKIGDDAKEAMRDCVSEFINFITNEANEICHREYRRTITPEDVLAAMDSLGLKSYSEYLSVYLDKYHAQDPEHGSSSRRPPVLRGEQSQAIQAQMAAATPRMAAPTPPPPQMAAPTPLFAQMAASALLFPQIAALTPPPPHMTAPTPPPAQMAAPTPPPALIEYPQPNFYEFLPYPGRNPSGEN